MAQLLNEGVVTARERVIIVNTTKIEGDEGTYWVADFRLGAQLDAADREILDGHFEQYKTYLA